MGTRTFEHSVQSGQVGHLRKNVETASEVVTPNMPKIKTYENGIE